MASADRKSYWRFDRDETSRVSTERAADRQPEADAHSPVFLETGQIAEDQGARPSSKRGPDPSVLRAAIDDGRAGDKVAHADPAAAPLGTDDEAAGTPATSERVAIAMRHELRAPKREASSLSWGSRFVMLVLGLAAVTALAIAGLDFFP